MALEYYSIWLSTLKDSYSRTVKYPPLIQFSDLKSCGYPSALQDILM